MAQVSSSSPRPSIAAALSGALPTVRLEVRAGTRRPLTHEVSDAGFLIGSVPGCDLRLPGADLPPVVCLITRHAGGASLRKLLPTQPVLVNGQPVTVSPLVQGDRVTLGAVEILVHCQPPSDSPGTPAVPLISSPSVGGQWTRLQQERDAFELEQKRRRQELEELGRQVDARQQELNERTQELETDRVIWYRRRQEMEQECQKLEAGNPAVPSTVLDEREKALEQHERDLATREEQFKKQQQELAGVRQELADIRQQLYDRYRQRRDRLAGLHEAINVAARKIQDRKRQVDAETQQAAARRAELDAQTGELDKADRKS